ncbi:MAG: hypothetical protein HYW25_00505 [Candidatus Aenigmarchaeota archaeon]|nr:hypothetical protein [Candidatus Aenigmarchaeota archaeon]
MGKHKYHVPFYLWFHYNLRVALGYVPLAVIPPGNIAANRHLNAGDHGFPLRDGLVCRE